MCILNATLVNDHVADVACNFVPEIAYKVLAISIIPLTPIDAISKPASCLKLRVNLANTQELSLIKL